ncbi:MAG: hypothetical protein KA275_01595 [Chitinophagaceae bacterium]|nr:hypothetical protein [Chitinophagaceae bacterium]
MNEYQKNNFNIVQLVRSFLHEYIIYLTNLNDKSKLTTINFLATKLATVEKNINPYTLEKIINNRLKISNAVCFDIIKDVQAIMNEEFVLTKAIIDDNTITISNLVFLSLQENINSIEDLEKDINEDFLISFWNNISQNANLYFAQKQLSTKISKQDIYIILNNLLNNLKQQ